MVIMLLPLHYKLANSRTNTDSIVDRLHILSILLFFALVIYSSGKQCRGKLYFFL